MDEVDVDLDDQECWADLAAQHIGRVGWSRAGAQLVLPVTCAVDGGRVVFRTSPRGEAHRTPRRPG